MLKREIGIMNKKKSKDRLIETYEFPEDQGVASLFVGSSKNGIPFKSLSRKGKKVTVIYEKDE